MKPRIEVYDALERIDRRAYQVLHDASRAPLFYDWRFLLAAERSPLLPARKTLYLCAYDGDELSGCPVDPLGLLARAAQVNDRGGDEFDLEQRSAQVERCFAPAHWARLRELRRRCDPDGVFHGIRIGRR